MSRTFTCGWESGYANGSGGGSDECHPLGWGATTNGSTVVANPSWWKSLGSYVLRNSAPGQRNPPFSFGQWVGFKFGLDAFPASESDVIFFADGGMSFTANPNGVVHIWMTSTGGIVYTSPANTLKVKTCHLIEIKAISGDQQFWLDGVLLFSYNSTNTFDILATSSDISLGGDAAIFYFDDFYANSATASASNQTGRRGGASVRALVPNGDVGSSPAGFTNSAGLTFGNATTGWFSAIDDTPPFLAANTDFIGKSTADTVVYETAFTDTPVGTVPTVVSLVSIIGAASAAAAQVNVSLKANAIDGNNVSYAPAVTTPLIGHYSIDVASSGVAWTKTLLDGATAKFGNSTDVTPNPKLFAMYLMYETLDPPKMATITDTFDTALDKAVKWNNSSAATIWDSTTRAKMPCTTSYWTLATSTGYDLTGSYLYARMFPPALGTGTRETFMELLCNAGGTDKLHMYVSGSALNARRVIGGSVSGSTSATYDPVAHAFWRIRESAGTIYYDVSADSITWTNFYNVSATGISVFNARPSFNCGYYGTETATDGFVDNVNTPAAVPVTTTLIDDFNRANGSVYSGAGSSIWATRYVENASTTFAAVIGNQLGTTQANSSAYTLSKFVTDFDYIIDCIVAPTGLPAMAFLMAVSNAGSTTWNEYYISFDSGGWTAAYYINGSGQSLGSKPGVAPVAGETYWVSKRGATIYLYKSVSGGAYQGIGIWGVPITSPFDVAGAFGISLYDTTQRWDNLRGGPTGAPNYQITLAAPIPMAGLSPADYATTVMADTPKAYYRLGDASGNAVDSSGNGYNATPNGTISYGANGLIVADTNKAISTTSGYFTNTSVPDNISDLTIEAWVSHNNVTAAARRFASRGISTGGWAAGVNATGNWRITTLGVKDYDFTASPLRDGSTVYHVVFVWRAAAFAVDLYINGVFSQTVTGAAAMKVAATDPFEIAARSNLEIWNGTVDEVAFYWGALSAARISAHYLAGVKTAGMLTFSPVKARTVSASTTITPALARKLLLGRSISATASMSAAMTVKQAVSKSISATTTLIPALSIKRSTGVSLPLTATLTPSLARFLKSSRTLSVTPTLTPVITRMLKAFRTFTLAPSFSPTVTVKSQRLISFVTGIVFTPDMTKVRSAAGRFVSLDAVTTLIPALAKISKFSRTQAATTTLTPAISRVPFLNRIFATTANFTVTQARKLSALRTLSTATSFSPSLTARSLLGRSLAASVSLSPALSRFLKVGRNLSTSVSMNPTLDVGSGKNKIFNATVTFAVAVKRFIAMRMDFALNFTPKIQRKSTTTMALSASMNPDLSRKALLNRIFASVTVIQAGLQKGSGVKISLPAALSFSVAMIVGRVNRVILSVSAIFKAALDFLRFVSRPTEDTLLGTALDPAQLLAVGDPQESEIESVTLEDDEIAALLSAASEIPELGQVGDDVPGLRSVS